MSNKVYSERHTALTSDRPTVRQPTVNYADLPPAYSDIVYACFFKDLAPEVLNI
jgi:hypothetical protein